MKILFTLNSSNYGGLEKTVLDLSRGLSDRGHQVFILCPTGDYLPEYKKFARVYTTKRISKIDFNYISYLIKILKKEKIDVIHSNDPRIGANSLIGAFFAGTPVKITHTHTPISNWQVSDRSKRINIFLYSLMVNFFSDYEICLSDEIKKIKLAEGIKISKLFTISNCLDPYLTSELSNLKVLKRRAKYPYFNFLNISRFTLEKNHLLLVQAFAEIYKLNKSVRLTLIGKGELSGEVQKLIKKLTLEEVVEIISEVTEDEKIEFLRHCHCFVLPTLAEGFGLVLIEAMTLSYPIVCSDLPVLREVSENRLIYFDSTSVNDLIEKMLVAIDTDFDSQKLLSNRELILNRYSFDKYIKSYEKIYLSKL